MRKSRVRRIRLYQKLMEEKRQLEREKQWLIAQLQEVTYGGVPISPPCGPIGCTWEEAATYACLPEDKKKNFRTRLFMDWEAIFNNTEGAE